MISPLLLTIAVLLISLTQANERAPSPQAVEPPLEWIEPETGHRVVRLSREPGTASLYFHQNPYTANGDKLVVTMRAGLAVINGGYFEADFRPRQNCFAKGGPGR